MSSKVIGRFDGAEGTVWLKDKGRQAKHEAMQYRMKDLRI